MSEHHVFLREFLGFPLFYFSLKIFLLSNPQTPSFQQLIHPFKVTLPTLLKSSYPSSLFFSSINVLGLSKWLKMLLQLRKPWLSRIDFLTVVKLVLSLINDETGYRKYSLKFLHDKYSAKLQRKLKIDLTWWR